ncbi:MAG: FimB/Mfa2 family fimbrial subunit [Tannerellaceae bacterium]|jgi:hypothetical protein|nr:FimB/Mfa2 family fimbrial subunit [Tannerellaceae bacterium]
MKKKNWYFLVFSVFFAACSSSEIYLDTPQSSSSVLRGLVLNSMEETNLPLPVSIYVFDSLDKCVDIQTLQKEDETFSFTLSPGSYTLSVISGASTEKYLLPDIDDATPNSPLILKSPEETHAELTAKTENIVLGNNAIEDLTITVNRVIAQITASINDVPDNVTSVSISLQPLEEQLLLNGSYGGEGNGQASFILIKESNGLWKTPTPVFVLPGSDNVSVTVTFTDTNGPHNYSYAKAIPVEANCKTNITATYKAGSTELSGSIRCSDWKDEHQVIIEFGDGSSGENNGQNANNEMLTQGDIYKGCYVLDVLQESSKQSTLLLMAPGRISDATIDQSISYLEKYSHLEFTNWRMLTINEAEILYDICSKGLGELNSILSKEELGEMKTNANYLCIDPAKQDLHYFTINASDFETVPKKDGIKYAARFVKEVTVKWESKNGK